MEVQELEKGCCVISCSLTGLSRTTCRMALTEAIPGLEAELALWSCPFHQFLVEDPQLPFVQLNGGDAGIDPPARSLLHTPSRPYLTACFSGEAASSISAGQLSPRPLSPHTLSRDILLAENEQCSLDLTSSAGKSKALQLPLTPMHGLGRPAFSQIHA